jgi:regulator of sigma E protease
MPVIGTILAFLAVLVVLVLVHELGHFLAAKRAGITVQEFGIGFPPRVGSVVWRGTRYSLNWIPLGGFVKMLGEDGDVEAQRMRERGLSEAAIDRAMEGAFNRKPIWVRLAVLLAGVLMNFLLAGVLFAFAVSMPIPEGRGPLTVTDVQPGSPAAAASLQAGDVIVAADGQTFEISRELTAYVRLHAGEEVALSIQRADDTFDITVTPRTEDELAPGEGPVGFSYEPASYIEVPSEVDGPVQAVGRGFAEAANLAYRIPGGLADAIGGMIGLNDNAGTAVGPIGIAEETGRVLEAPLVSQLIFMGLLSVNLAVLNVLPFPPLDGGRIAVVLIEGIRRRRLPAEREALIYLTGFMVLIALVILISIQDVQRLIEG